MAKTFRNLWPHIVSWDNLLQAYHRCRRRKRAKPDAVRFDFDWEANLLDLQRQLNAGTYEPGAYRHFTIFDPKQRTISAAPFRDRVVHHAVVQVLEPLFEKRFVHDSYACRKGKGTHRALRRAQQFLRCYPYYLKTDIVKFFPSVDHAVLLHVLSARIHDERLMSLLAVIVATGRGVLDAEVVPGYYAGDDLFAVCRPRGLPIGNLTSQFFANVLLDPIDHFIKEELRAEGYVRYCDDLVLFGNDKARLRASRRALEEQLAGLRLRLHEDKTQLRPSRCGLKYLGFVLWPEQRRLQQGCLVRFNRRLRRWRWLKARGLIRASDIRRSVQAWRAHVQHANSLGIRRVLCHRSRSTVCTH